MKIHKKREKQLQNKKIDKPMFTSENQTRSIFALRKATRYQRTEPATILLDMESF